MGTEEYLLDKYKREGIQTGIKKGIKEGEAIARHDFVENLILKFNFSDEQAAVAAEVSVAFVKKVRKELLPHTI